MSPPVQQTIRETEIEASVLAGPGGSAWHASRALWAAQGIEKEQDLGPVALLGSVAGTFLFCFAMEGFYYGMSSFLNYFFNCILIEV